MIPPNQLLSTRAAYNAAANAGLRPDPVLTISEWADRYRVLSQRASSEPGPWRTDRTPYLREIMDTLSPSSAIERVVFQKAAQIGATEAGNNWMGYVIHQAPGPMMAVQPTVEMSKRNSKGRIEPLIEDSDALRGLVKDPRSRDSGNTILAKEFPGGILVMTGANSAVGLRSMAARYLFLDEVDAYVGDVEGEGDPVNLAIARTRTFSRRKIFLASTPKVTGISRIEAAFEESDQRRYFVPCPACAHMQTLRFAQLRWPKGAWQRAVYVCEGCGQEIQNHQKAAMLAAGQWRAQAAGDGKTAGFHLSSLYSPVGWLDWAEIAHQFEQAQRSTALLQVFVNTVLGETWTMLGEAPEWQKLYDRRETYQIGTVPEAAAFLTAGVDVQKDRIEVEVVAWGPRKESWSVEYRVLEGDTGRAPVWERLTAMLGETWPSADGADMTLLSVAIDSGYATSEVYTWARTAGQRVMITKGVSTGAVLLDRASPTEIGPLGAKLRKGLRLWSVNVSIAKEELYRWLRQEKPTDEDLARGVLHPPGYCHFPKYSEEYFKQITAEQLVTRIVKGYKKPEWQKMRERNEALDARVYARAAAARVGIDRFTDGHWAEMARRTKGYRPPPPMPVVPPPPPVPVPAPQVPQAVQPAAPLPRPAVPVPRPPQGRPGPRWRI